MSDNLNRRNFIGASSAAIIVPSHVLGGTNNTSPSDKINVAYVGCGTQGLRQLMQLLPRQDVRVVAVCDPNKDSSDYIEWGKNELRDKVRNFLKNSKWGSNDGRCRCGRDVGLEIVNTYYKSQDRSYSDDCRGYIDFRELLEKERDLDACYIMTPDHLHATVAIAAMEKGKHVIMHKALANILYEVRKTVETAKKTKVATHMFCAAGNTTTPMIKEWIDAGAIGKVKEVHNWSSRPFWPQGMTERPAGMKVPGGLNWNLWLGPVPDMPYDISYTHAVFRGWYDFGAGALGDMGHYSLYQIFRILNLDVPVSVEASRSQFWKIDTGTWHKQTNMISYPRSSMIHFEFGSRGNMPPVDLYWYDGGMRPPRPRELDVDEKKMPDEGMMFVGDNGKILADFTGTNPRIIPSSIMKQFKAPPQTLPRPASELDQWLNACKGQKPSGARFEFAGKLSETVNLGNIALRVSDKLLWDKDKMQFTNSSEANRLIRRREYRKGWEI